MHAISIQDVGLLLTHVDMTEPLAVRDQSAVELMAHCGLRVGELIGLDVFDVYHNGQARPRLFVRPEISKGGYGSRFIPLNQVARKAVERLIDVNKRRGFSVDPHAPLFVTKRHQRLTTRAVQYIVADLRERAGLTAQVTPHELRRCFGTEVMRATGNAAVASALLGHAHVDTCLKHYVRPSDADLVDAVERLAQRGGRAHV